ncbi:DUF1800 domain-containing protein [Flavihumibacter solisilvae]|uniref:DUF1800 domain-containing protein n=1 Tax=Flavihumibacter solisilvae TaxID=1349421 RepID=UPI00068B974E|nr:DUF1800 domain-containing protein [Flavihumibacter solisilvae]
MWLVKPEILKVKKHLIHNRHLLWRAAFGPSTGDVNALKNSTPRSIYHELLQASAGIIKPISVQREPVASGEPIMPGTLPDDALRKLQREEVKVLNLLWLDEMCNGKAQLREKMAFFWHGHFACRNRDPRLHEKLLHVIRTNALENFGTLLKGVSRSAAMVYFLNNNQNRKGHPNENFARELMELFTMGRGYYTEADVQESARAFTGWSTDKAGEFVFRKQLHDQGRKSFLGRQGNFTGDDIIDIILEQPATATFITTKLYRFYVSESPDPAHVDWLSKRFYQSGYNIRSLLEDILLSDWFYHPSIIGNRIKSPVELLAGVRRQFPMAVYEKSSQLMIQRVLGQTLFVPPGVAGWPTGRGWIDGASLLFRLRLPALLSLKKQDAWTTFAAGFAEKERSKIIQALTGYWLQSPSSPSSDSMLHNVNAGDPEDKMIMSVSLNLLSTPEYQMC